MTPSILRQLPSSIACRWALGLTLVLLAAKRVEADVRLPAIFSNHMVLQRGVDVPIWGWADHGENVTVTVAGRSGRATAGPDGRWRILLGPLAAGGPHVLTVAGRNRLEVGDVLVGEVWLGSGQSNMNLTVAKALNFEQERAAARYPQMRVFTVMSDTASTEKDDCSGNWQVCSPETFPRFSATAYFFGREILQQLRVPVGLVVSCVGGTPIQAWIAADVQRRDPALKGFFDAYDHEMKSFDAAAEERRYQQALAIWSKGAEAAKATGSTPPRPPKNPLEVRSRQKNLGGLFNGKIAPLIPYALRGVLWYQGEGNTGPDEVKYYKSQLSRLVLDWRRRWGAELPFAWVQLPNYIIRGRDWPGVREQMLQALELPRTGMAVTIDIGDPADIHPANKQEVGRRLALWALGTVYGRTELEYSGPLPAGHAVRDGEIVLSFRHTTGGLRARGGELVGFQVAGEDRTWLPAQARIEGAQVVVSHPRVARPVAVRYAWENNPVCNLYNGAGLPASPFRTDTW